MQPGPQFQQLDMFKTAHELKHGNIQHIDRRHGDTADEMWNDKLRRVDMGGLSNGWGRVENAHEGIHEPVEVSHWERGVQQLTDGHHRVAAAYRHNPQSLIPVEHVDEDQIGHMYAAQRGDRR